MDIRNVLITYWELLIKAQDTPKNIMDALAAEIASIISE
jgi:hypothetical protein